MLRHSVLLALCTGLICAANNQVLAVPPPNDTDVDLISQIPLSVSNSSGISYFDAESDGRGRMLIAFIQYENVRLPRTGVLPYLKVYGRGVTLPFSWVPLFSMQLSSDISDSVLALNLTTAQWVDGLTAPRKGFVTVTMRRAATNTIELYYFSGPAAQAWTLLPGGMPTHRIFTGPTWPPDGHETSATIAALRTQQADYTQLFVGVLFLDYNPATTLHFVKLIQVTEGPNSLTTSTTNVTGPGSATGDLTTVGWPRFASDAQNIAGLVSYQSPTTQPGFTKVWKLTTTVNPMLFELVGETSRTGSCHNAEIKAQQGLVTMTCLGVPNASYNAAFTLDMYSFTSTPGSGLGVARRMSSVAVSTGDIELFRNDAHITANTYAGSSIFGPKFQTLAWDSDDVTNPAFTNAAVKINDYGVTGYARPRVVCAPPGNSPAYCDYLYATGTSFPWPFSGPPTAFSLLNLDPS